MEFNGELEELIPHVDEVRAIVISSNDRERMERRGDYAQLVRDLVEKIERNKQLLVDGGCATYKVDKHDKDEQRLIELFNGDLRELFSGKGYHVELWLWVTTLAEIRIYIADLMVDDEDEPDGEIVVEGQV